MDISIIYTINIMQISIQPAGVALVSFSYHSRCAPSPLSDSSENVSITQRELQSVLLCSQLIILLEAFVMYRSVGNCLCSTSSLIIEGANVL